MKNLIGSSRMAVSAILFLFFTAACDLVPKEAVELSNTVGRDLEEVHRAHIALAELHFGQIKERANTFIDEVYRPAFIAKFAEEAKLADAVRDTVANNPEELLAGLTQFVQVGTERVEKKRRELLGPIEQQEAAVIRKINEAHRQIQAAQAIVTGHLASVRKVREVQNEILAGVGLKGLREEIATTTARVSGTVDGLVVKGKAISGKVDNAENVIREFDAKISEAVEGIRSRFETK